MSSESRAISPFPGVAFLPSNFPSSAPSPTPGQVRIAQNSGNSKFPGSGQSSTRLPQSVSSSSLVNLSIEYRFLSEKLRDLQFELSSLSQNLREKHSDQERKAVRYLRRSVISSNCLLAGWVFLIEFVRAFRRRKIHRGIFGRIFVPVFSSNSLSSVLVSAVLYGIQHSAPYTFSIILNLRPAAWQRNFSFLFSVFYSIFLMALPSFSYYPRVPLAINTILNILYIGARYHYLHGLGSFASLRIL